MHQTSCLGGGGGEGESTTTTLKVSEHLFSLPSKLIGKELIKEITKVFLPIYLLALNF